ncbi:MAG: hypothetical protein Ct9H300mP7_5050 [Verrucomicrobiota bacterium]|nr:MAG: hypothetical protein Ct9H300mP7_5050 [Verrucomicrobiota bacterium]
MMFRHSILEVIKAQIFWSRDFLVLGLVGWGQMHGHWQRSLGLPTHGSSRAATLPKPQQGANAIDHFIIDRLARRAMTMSTPAKPQQQARRVFPFTLSGTAATG